jgi:hypothetical protein
MLTPETPGAGAEHFLKTTRFYKRILRCQSPDEKALKCISPVFVLPENAINGTGVYSRTVSQVLKQEQIAGI